MTFHPPSDPIFCQQSASEKLDHVWRVLARFGPGLPANVLKNHLAQIDSDEVVPLLEGLERQERVTKEVCEPYPTIWRTK